VQTSCHKRETKPRLESLLNELRWWKRRSAFIGSRSELSPGWAELWKRCDKLYPASEYPIVNQIHLAIFRRCESLTEPLPQRLSHEAKCLIQIGKLKDLEELMGLVFPRVNAKKRRLFMEQAVSKLPHDQATALLRQMKRGLAGRPPDQRAKALRALEMQILNPRLTWEQIGKRLNYKAAGFQRPISERLPAEVRSLKRILRKHGIFRSSKTPRKNHTITFIRFVQS
jgi:hypothetical protein